MTSYRVSAHRLMGDGTIQLVDWQIWFSRDLAELYADAWLNRDDTLQIRMRVVRNGVLKGELERYG